MRASIRYAVVIAALAIPAAALGADVLSQLGITLDAAQAAVGSVISAGLYNPGLPAKAFTLLPPAARAQATTAGVAWVKAYVASPDFARQYAELRQHRKPEAPTWPLTPEQEMQKADEDQKRQVEESKKAIAALPAEQRKQVEEAMANAAAFVAKMNTPEWRKMRLDSFKTERATRQKEYEADVAKWKQDYPEDAKAIITRRLREFLQLSADVDFNATLKPDGDRQTFTNPAYQAKSSQWKTCYRAGREATTAARAAAQAWLRELGG